MKEVNKIIKYLSIYFQFWNIKPTDYQNDYWQDLR